MSLLLDQSKLPIKLRLDTGLLLDGLGSRNCLDVLAEQVALLGLGGAHLDDLPVIHLTHDILL